MLANPQLGWRVLIHYATKPKAKGLKAPCDVMPHHGKHGTIIVVAKGKPRNHGVRLDDGTLTAIPCGNLRKEFV